MLFQWNPRTWNKVRWGLLYLYFIISVYFQALRAWVRRPRRQRRTRTRTVGFVNRETGSPKLTTTEATTDGGEANNPSGSEASQASFSAPAPLSSEQRRTLEWVRQGSHDDSFYVFDYAQDVHCLEANVPLRPQSEGSEPRKIEAGDTVEEDEVADKEEIDDIQHTIDDETHSSTEIGLHMDDTTEEVVVQAEEEDVGQEVTDHGDTVDIQHINNNGEKRSSTQIILPTDDTIEDVLDTGAEEIRGDEGVSSESDGEEVRPESIERPSTSLSFHYEDESHKDDDDEEVATTNPATDITKEYELPLSEEEAEEEAAVENTPEEEAAKETIETVPALERITQESPRLRHQNNLSPERRTELLDLRSKLELLQSFRARENKPESLEVVNSSVSSASSSTTTAAPQQQQDEDMALNEPPGLSPQKRAELVDLRTKLRIFMEMREQEQNNENSPVEPSVQETIVEKAEEDIEEEGEVETNESFDETSQTPETTDSNHETDNNVDEMTPPPPPEGSGELDELEEQEEPVSEEDETLYEDDGLVDPFSSDGTEILDFIKTWLLLSADLSALEVFHQVANLRDIMTFVPTWVPTKHDMVRQDEVLTYRSQDVPYEINWHFMRHLRSLRWRDLLDVSGSMIEAADREWLEAFLEEMATPSFVFKKGRVRSRSGHGRVRRRRSSSRSGTTTPGGAAAGQEEGGRRQGTKRRTLLHQVEAAEPLLPHEEKYARAMNQILWTRHAHETAHAVVQAIYDNTVERAAWIDERASEVRGELEVMEQGLQRLVDGLASLKANVDTVAEAHELDHAYLAILLQQNLLV
ncbi:hypothetical protein PG999_013494 [Apiospora kogelbergensis]|uniref:Uncharacterized protein n=1 Tax=Apiospora kogelbergensis TaxID=1337665 RepID=A0AAW0QFE6_9PEZI